MGVTLDALRELQEIEHQIVDIRRQLKKKESIVAVHQKKIAGFQSQIAAARGELQRLQVEFQAQDTDIKARSAQIAKQREHLNSVRTNKEYASFLAQLNNDRADLTRIEQAAMEQMQAIESQQAAIAALQEQMRAEEVRRDELADQSGQAQQSYSVKLEQLLAQRKKAAGGVPADALQTFERLSDRFDGEVLVKCERTHPRKDEFICSGCYMSLTTEVANALLTRDELRTCRNCGRILYFDKS